MRLLILTVQRTGGTTLTNSVLMAFPDHKALHEPFLKKREWGSFAVRHVDGAPASKTLSDLKQALSGDLVIKHCCELLPLTFNKLLVDAAIANGFRFLVLYRENEWDRLRSKLFTKRTGIYGRRGMKAKEPTPDDLTYLMRTTDRDVIDVELKRSRLAAEALLDSVRTLRTAAQPFYVTRYEDLFADRESGLRNFERMIDYFDADPETWRTNRQSVLEFFESREQGTKSFYDHLPLSDLDRETSRARWRPLADYLGVEPPGPVGSDGSATVRSADGRRA